MAETIESRGPFEQFVLLAVTELSVDGETPAHSFEVAKRCKAHLEDVDRDPFGGVERSEVTAALGSLADDGLLGKERTESATGKGRPAYALDVDPETVVDAVDDEAGVGPYAEQLRQRIQRR
ncbi:hypothetical protein [Halomicrobium salinisoli]|uniref:hypothetical protein n=1 Tax=Halomicrobium salinisoli TaxID=2878391 RepID=UPI001CEFF8BB|nr:hypothetical protein [Halomicrobium salinisoli]